MARYIEAEEARSVLLMRMAGTGYQSRAMNAIYDVPTAYVMAVNEGEWICTECAYTWKCSVCGNEHYGTRTNFCSNCGAKMKV